MKIWGQRDSNLWQRTWLKWSEWLMKRFVISGFRHGLHWYWDGHKFVEGVEKKNDDSQKGHNESCSRNQCQPLGKLPSWNSAGSAHMHFILVRKLKFSLQRCHRKQVQWESSCNQFERLCLYRQRTDWDIALLLHLGLHSWHFKMYFNQLLFSFLAEFLLLSLISHWDLQGLVKTYFT